MTRPPPARSELPAAAPSVDATVAIEDDRWLEHIGIENAVTQAVDAACGAYPELFAGGGDVAVVLSSDSHVTALNGDFRGKPQPTNVLSFPADARATEPGAAPYLGDIILARETIEREAHEAGVPVAHHVQHLTIHGLLHLRGFDHQTDDDADAMEALETRVLQQLNVADPYAREHAPLLPLTEPDFDRS